MTNALVSTHVGMSWRFMRQLKPASLGPKKSALLIIYVFLVGKNCDSYMLDSSVIAQKRMPCGLIAKHNHSPDHANLLHRAIDA